MKLQNKTVVINGRFLTQSVTGVQRFAVEISLGLVKLYDNVVVLTPFNIVQKEINEKLNGKIIGKNKGHIWEQYDLPRYLKHEYNENFILLNLCNTGPILLKNSIVTIHDIAVLKFPEWYSKPFYIFYKFLLPLLVKKALHIITVSEFSKSEILQYFSLDESKVSVVYNAVSEFPNSDDSLDNPYDKYKNYFLALSSLNPRKNFKRTIEAFISSEVNAQLLLVGGNDKSFMDSKIYIPTHYKDKIHFLGYVSDKYLPYLFTNAIGFLYLSLYEGFGIPPLEAMQYDCPVLVSNTTSMPEICKNAALYVDPTSVSEISNIIKEIFYNKSDKFAQQKKNAKNLLQSYSWEKSSISMLNIIDKIVS